MSTQGKVILITGASRGIGKECALKLAGDNVTLVLVATNKDKLNEVAKECATKGAKTKCVALNLSSSSKHIQKILVQLKEDLGHIDVLINNAGIWLEEAFEKGNMDAWDKALDVNLTKTIHLTKYCLEVMPENGAIIFIGSIASRKSYAGGTNYCAAKFGLLGFAGALFEDIREKGIKVCSILPGVVNTDMHKDDESLNPEKMIQPQDVAKTVEFALNMPNNVCPTEITLMPQRNPKTYSRK